MSHEEGRGCREGCRACNNPLLGAVYVARTVCAVVAVAAGTVALIWDITWVPALIAAGAWIGITAGLWAPVLPLAIRNWSMRRQIEKRQQQIQGLRQEAIQLQILHSQREAEIAQKNAYITALQAERLELERLLAQRRLEQEARETRQRLQIAHAAIEADRLEAAAWRVEFTARQLEIKLGQADLFESLSAIEDNAQDRIIAAYEQGFDHGQRGIVFPIKQLRHLRIVEDSA